MKVRMTLVGLVMAGHLCLVVPVMAQASMTVREFNQIASSTPRNPLSLMRPSVRRAWDTVEGSINAARAEEERARSAGQPSPFCIPGRTNISPNDFMRRMGAVPPAQQGQTVNQAVRVWMVERFPCR